VSLAACTSVLQRTSIPPRPVASGVASRRAPRSYAVDQQGQSGCVTADPAKIAALMEE
jgi:hypothetical protein